MYKTDFTTVVSQKLNIKYHYYARLITHQILSLMTVIYVATKFYSESQFFIIFFHLFDSKFI